MTVKQNDKEYININYEWNSKNSIPDFVMDIVALIKANKESAKVKSKLEAEKEAKLYNRIRKNAR